MSLYLFNVKIFCYKNIQLRKFREYKKLKKKKIPLLAFDDFPSKVVYPTIRTHFNIVKSTVLFLLLIKGKEISIYFICCRGLFKDIKMD